MFINTPVRAVFFGLSDICLIIGYERMDIAIILTVILFSYNFIYLMHCNKYKFRYFLPHLFFATCMYFILIIGAFTYKNKNWVKTKHAKVV